MVWLVSALVGKWNKRDRIPLVFVYMSVIILEFKLSDLEHFDQYWGCDVCCDVCVCVCVYECQGYYPSRCLQN